MEPIGSVPDQPASAEQDTEHQVHNLEYSLEMAPETGSRWKRSLVPRFLLRPSTVDSLLLEALHDWTWILTLQFFSWNLSEAWYPFFCLMIAGRFHGLGVILHDATHMPLRGKTWKVRLLELVSGYPVASTLNAMRYHHIRHHRDSGQEADPYFTSRLAGHSWMYGLVWLRHLVLVPFWVVRSFYGTVASFVPGMLPSYARVFLLDRSADDLRASREVQVCAKEERYQFLFFVLVFAATAIWPETLLYGYWLPVILAGMFAGYRLLAEHRYERIQDRTIASIVKTTNDHSVGPISRMFLAPHNVGLHLLHHIHPQVGMNHLPALRNWYQQTYREEYPRPLGGALAQL